MSVDGSNYRPNNSIRQPYRHNFFQQTSRPNVIVEELHNQEAEGSEFPDQYDHYFSEAPYVDQQDFDYLESGVATFENDSAQVTFDTPGRLTMLRRLNVIDSEYERHIVALIFVKKAVLKKN
ncbi:unnamed protein product [Acanthoscelides obtectus]|uniref:Uncharacterized protein n=1 Tax=Acanthoscelides obtectus TaxID=200917 RepID=A0A9P0Q3D2_ACAOB|nr:unnamed protein product [Acanthoscelides obtectus]CAK1624236.1 hypothetical protein AOBTE_LOCUS2429 [Acanthoscelides obtectus]